MSGHRHAPLRQGCATLLGLHGHALIGQLWLLRQAGQRETGDGLGVTLVANEAGLDAVGIELDNSVAPEIAPKVRTPREGAKHAILIAMLRATGGASIEEIMAAKVWQ